MLGGIDDRVSKDLAKLNYRYLTVIKLVDSK